jgi:hypothetical protein
MPLLISRVPAEIWRGIRFTPGALVHLLPPHPMITAMPRERSGCRLAGTATSPLGE